MGPMARRDPAPWIALAVVAALAAGSSWFWRLGSCARMEAEYAASKGMAPHMVWEAARCYAARGDDASAGRLYLHAFLLALDHDNLPFKEIRAEYAGFLHRSGNEAMVKALDDCGFYRQIAVQGKLVLMERLMYAAHCYVKAGKTAQAREVYRQAIGYDDGTFGAPGVVVGNGFSGGRQDLFFEAARKELEALPPD